MPASPGQSKIFNWPKRASAVEPRQPSDKPKDELMADETPQAPAANGAAPAQPQGPQMRLLGQYLKDLSFESPNAPGILTKLNQKPEIKIDMNTRNKVVEQGLEVELTMKAACAYGGEQGFLVECTYAATVALNEDLNEQVKAILVNVEVPQMLFPYIRALMSDLTAQGAFPPLVMQPLDFRAAFIKRVQEQAAKAQKQ